MDGLEDLVQVCRREKVLVIGVYGELLLQELEEWLAEAHSEVVTLLNLDVVGGGVEPDVNVVFEVEQGRLFSLPSSF